MGVEPILPVTIDTMFNFDGDGDGNGYGGGTCKQAFNPSLTMFFCNLDAGL